MSSTKIKHQPVSRQKRPRLDADQTENFTNDYAGYSFPVGHEEICLDRVDALQISPADFFAQYIAKRRPCIIINFDKSENGTPAKQQQQQQQRPVTPDTLVQVAGDCRVQVEKRPSTQQSFGQNRTAELQVMMTIRDLMNHLRDKNERELYYLSTQEADEKDGAPSPFALPPCKQLLQGGYIPETLSLAGNLILQSCNLWMGASSMQSSSGLHHDFHDNFYWLWAGKKQFRLYSPADAEQMAVMGKMDRVHFNGLISYSTSATRADGFPLDASDKIEEKEDDGNEESGDDEEQVVLGKGFDYKSDSDDEENHPFDGVDDYETLVGKDEVGTDDDDNDGNDDENPFEEGAGKIANRRRPDHFSVINLTDEAQVKEHFPALLKCRECIVELEAGECLYLPASWFHFVTSFRDETPNENETACHMALNYWYHPPDRLDYYENPYQQDDWKKHTGFSNYKK